ncbi:hypothetical protein [Candidatus Pristimantibacillus sp. PTI5]
MQLLGLSLLILGVALRFKRKKA